MLLGFGSDSLITCTGRTLNFSLPVKNGAYHWQLSIYLEQKLGPVPDFTSSVELENISALWFSQSTDILVLILLVLIGLPGLPCQFAR